MKRVFRGTTATDGKREIGQTVAWHALTHPCPRRVGGCKDEIAFLRTDFRYGLDRNRPAGTTFRHLMHLDV